MMPKSKAEMEAVLLENGVSLKDQAILRIIFSMAKHKITLQNIKDMMTGDDARAAEARGDRGKEVPS